VVKLCIHFSRSIRAFSTPKEIVATAARIAPHIEYPRAATTVAAPEAITAREDIEV
jgi:hypothetical protein